MPNKKTLQALAAAGRKLRIEPETFDITMGKLKGIVTSVKYELKEGTPVRVMDPSGRVSTVPGGDLYLSTFEVKWLTTDPSMIQEIADTMTEMGRQIAQQNRLMIQQQHGEFSSLDYLTTERE